MNNDLAVKFAILKLEKFDQLLWMEIWNGIDTTDDDRMDITEFHKFFNITEMDNWLTRRLFDLFNTQLNGFINFHDFLHNAFQYCAYDREKCVELSFRLLSRRGAGFDRHQTVLDLIDFETFVRERYYSSRGGEKKAQKNVNPKKISKDALSLFALVDDEMTGGERASEASEPSIFTFKLTRRIRLARITRFARPSLKMRLASLGAGISFDEFRTFALVNTALLSYGYFFQSLLRKVIERSELYMLHPLLN